MSDPPVYRVTLRAQPDGVPPVIRLRKFLKVAIRSFGLKCLEVLEEPPVLVKVKYLDYERGGTYAPAQVEALLNTNDVVSAVPTEARGSGPFLSVNLRDGTTMTIIGTPDTLLGAGEPNG